MRVRVKAKRAELPARFCRRERPTASARENNLLKRLAMAFLCAIAATAPDHSSFAQDNSIEMLKNKIANLSEIRLSPGVNSVKFNGVDRKIQIIDADFDNGNAHGHRRFFIIAKSNDDTNEWEVVPIQMKKAGAFDDTIRDDPFTGESVIKSVRFFNGSYNGELSTLLITAERDLSLAKAYSDPVIASISVFSLLKATEPGPQRYFAPVARAATKQKYCNADAALLKELSISVPRDYAGPNKQDGCFPQ